ncbi:MAG: hypothetical protein WCH52_04800 [Bacteroidota bacterium]
MKYILFSLLLTFILSDSFSQAASYTDPAAAYMRVMFEKGSEGSYQQISNFKVIGTSYLYGEKLPGSIYTKSEKSEHTNLSYNTYNQQVDVYLNATNQIISKKPSEVDSFIIYNSNSDFYKEDLLFYTSKLVSPLAKDLFYQVLLIGPKYNLYKNFTANLDIVSTNYIQSELRQFNLEYNYYYLNNSTNEFKKIKLSRKKIIEDFSKTIDLSPSIDFDEINNNPEIALKKIFNILNNKQ